MNKKLYLSLGIFLLSSVLCFSQGRLHIGLIGELSYLKNNAEYHASRIINDKSLEDSTRAKAAWKYQEFTAVMDQFILQMAGDKRRNYKVIDNALIYKRLEFLFPEEFNESRQRAYLTGLKRANQLMIEISMLAVPSEEIRTYNLPANWNNASQPIAFPPRKKFRYVGPLLMTRPVALGALINQ